MRLWWTLPPVHDWNCASVQAALTRSTDDALLLANLMFRNGEYDRVLFFLESRNVLEPRDPKHLRFLLLATQCYVRGASAAGIAAARRRYCHEADDGVRFRSFCCGCDNAWGDCLVVDQ